jgi:Fungal pheromone mating factor STE2 GPCR
METFPDFEPGMTFAVAPDFDPLTQPIWYMLKNGTLDLPVTFKALDTHLSIATEWCVVYGCAIGAGVMTLLHVLALTPLTKRRTLIYWLNVIGLGQVIARGIIQTLYFTRDTWQTNFVYLSGDSTSVPTLHRVHSTLSVMLSLSSIATVEIIFFVQGRAILSSLPRKLYYALLSTLVLFGIVAVTMRLIYAVYNVQDIWVWNNLPRNTMKIPRWCEPVSKSLFSSPLLCAHLLTLPQHWQPMWLPWVLGRLFGAVSLGDKSSCAGR